MSRLAAGFVTDECRLQVLLQHNAKVYLAARSKSKANAAIADLKAATGKDAIFIELDLSSLASVRQAAEQFLAHEPELHILINNAYVGLSADIRVRLTRMEGA